MPEFQDFETCNADSKVIHRAKLQVCGLIHAAAFKHAMIPAAAMFRYPAAY
jgi:hypothetical protein